MNGYRINICCIIKDEQEYLKEFIEHHIKLGVNKIYLFEDYFSSSHYDITKNYPNVILSSLKEYNVPFKVDSGRLFLLYIKYANDAKNNNLCDWCLFIDVDEFVIFLKEYNFERLCKEYENYPGIYLSWANIGACGHIIKPKNSLFESYMVELRGILIDHNPIWNKKSFVNINKFDEFLNLHLVKDGIDTAGNKYIYSPLTYNKAYLKHFYTKSFEDYCDRMFKRGNMSNNYRSFDLFFVLSPELLSLKETLLDRVKWKKPKSTMYISRRDKIIGGGNLKYIKQIESKLRNHVISLSKKLLVFLKKLLFQHNPKNIIEFGSGKSTKIFENYIRNFGGNFITIEHDPKYKTKYAKLLLLLIGGEFKFKDTSIINTNIYKGLEKVLLEKYDFILIDGPFSNDITQKYARIQLLLFSELDKLADESIILIHDYDRLNVKNTVDLFIESIKDKFNYNIKEITTGEKALLQIDLHRT